MEPYQQLEHDWAEFNQLEPAGMVACSSGTAALHLATACLGINPMRKVLVPEFTMVACARAVVLAGLKPVFVDCNERLLSPPDLYGEALVFNTRALMAVHIYGRRCAMTEIAQICSENVLFLIEDLAEAHGILPHEQTDAACWSFYRNKVVAGEEGGAVWFQDPANAVLARKMRNLGFSVKHDFWHFVGGMNYRLSNCHASLILESLGKYFENMKHRLNVEAWYDELIPAEWKMPLREVPWVYDIRIPWMYSRRQDRLVESLNARGIAARHGFKPMSMQPEFAGVYKDLAAYVASREVIYLPISPEMTQARVREIVSALEVDYAGFQK